MSGDISIYEAFATKAKASNPNNSNVLPYQMMAWRIRDAMPQASSIDNYIDANRGDEVLAQCCKLAIVRSILDAEKKCPLYIDPRQDISTPRFDKIEGTWLTSFFRLLSENCQVSQLAQRFSTLSLVIFNYDRCVEHYLYHTLQNYYGISGENAAQLIEHLSIYHPYGVVGALPWQKHSKIIDFGATPLSNDLLYYADQIRTFTEGTDPSTSTIVKLRHKLLDANVVLFLGFAYHRLNIELLRPDGLLHRDPQNTKYFGTAIDISESDCGIIVDELHSIGSAPHKNILLRRDLDCVNLFKEFGRSLSLVR